MEKTATLKFELREYPSELQMAATYIMPVAPRSVVLTLRAIGESGDSIAHTCDRLHYSKLLDSYFIYAPPAEGPALIRLGRFQFAEPIADVEMSTLAWPSAEPIDELFGDFYVGHTSRFHSAGGDRALTRAIIVGKGVR